MLEMTSSDIKVYRVRYQNSNTSHNLYVSPNIKLCLVVAGEAVWQIGNRNLTVQKDDMILLNNQQKRVFKSVLRELGIEMIVLEFEPLLYMNDFQAIFYNKNERYDCQMAGYERIRRLFYEIEEEDQERRYQYRRIVEAKVTEILVLIGRAYDLSEQDVIKMSGEMYQVLTYLNENYTSDLSLKNVAVMLHVSESSFSKHFLKYMGTGFAQYMMQRRIGYAIGLLQSTEKTVLEIALECGYNNTASFYKAFKKLTHLTPRDYRNKTKNYYF